MDPSGFLLAVMTAAYALGAASAFLAPSTRSARALVAAGAVAGSGAGLGLALYRLAGTGTLELDVPWLFNLLGGLSFRLDRLGAFFLLLVNVVALPAALFGGPYSREYETRCPVRALGALFNAFLLTMSLVPLAANVPTFLFAWEAMALASYFLVMTEAGDAETRRAGLWYLGIAHAGLACVAAAFFLLGAGAPGTAFADLRVMARALSPAARNAAFLLALVGFGSKAGMVPLHVWLPMAHPAAPSHVSALMSGGMIKLGIYGLLRLTLDLSGGGPAWWGGLVLAMGAASALLGVLSALVENDLKRLLAFSSIENVGLILMGLGAGLLFQGNGLTALATLALVGSLYHALNHACFKGLLFLGAGAVLYRTHTRNLEELGGLIKGMPRTGLCFLVGAVAISGLPPLNGFMSEWLLFQALLGGASLPRPELGLLMPLAVATLALTGGLAAVCFVKAFGITFLALPRSDRAADPREVPAAMQAAMAMLALACVALGVAAPSVASWLRVVVTELSTPAGAARATSPAPVASLLGSVGTISPPILALALVVPPALVLLAGRLGFAARRVRIAETWGCGRIGQTARMEYTSTAFAEPLRRVFAELYRPTEDLSIDFHPESRYFVQSMGYRSGVHPWFERWLYGPTVILIRQTAARVRGVQSGSLHRYLLYIVLALVALLLVSRWPG